MVPSRRPSFMHVAADEPEADLVVALGAHVELGEAAVGAVLGEHPIERARPGDVRRLRVRLPPVRHESNAGSSTVSARCDGGVVVGAERLVLTGQPALRAHVGTLKKYPQPPLSGLRRT